MSFANKKYMTAKHSVQSTTSEMDKLEKTHKSELRMISTAAFKFRSKFIRVEDPRRWQSETEACNVRMYETHFPGFCYLKDGKCRKKYTNSVNTRTADPIESTKKIKALLFTGEEIDIHKVICLHLLGTHVQNRRHIHRKDGRPCSFVKAPTQGGKRLTLQAVSQRMSSNEKEVPSVYDKMLPRYILDVRFVDRIFSNISLHAYDLESVSDDESGKRKKFQVPVYVNNDVRAIVGSVIEALEAVDSPKLKDLLSLASNPDELKNLLMQEEIQEFIVELAGNPLVTRATAYDLVMAYPAFDKGSDGGTKETLAQVLEIITDCGLRNMLHIIRKTISRRYEELVQCNVLPGKKKGEKVCDVMDGLSSQGWMEKMIGFSFLTQFRAQGGKGSMMWNLSKTSFISGEQSTKTCSSVFPSGVLIGESRFNRHLGDSSERLNDNYFLDSFNDGKNERSSHLSLLRSVTSPKVASQSARSLFHFRTAAEQSKMLATLDDVRNGEEHCISIVLPSENKNDSRIQHFGRYQESDITKSDLKSLNNSQRILLGLKVASMKNRPVNMHQFENKKKIDMGSLIASVVHSTISDANPSESFFEENPYSRGQKRARRTMSKIDNCKVHGLGDLSRGVLSNFRHEISTSENKKRVREFMNSPFHVTTF